MTREEQIEKVEIKYFDETRFDGCDDVGEAAKTAAFIAGAKWADEHPKEGLVRLDKVIKYLEQYHIGVRGKEFIEDFINAME